MQLPKIALFSDFRVCCYILITNLILGESGSPENTYNASMSDTSSVKSDQQQQPAASGEQELKESIFKSQMRRLNRELPISDVYHERNIGLGMAPPLSKLIMTNNLQVVQVDHHSSGNQWHSGVCFEYKKISFF